MATMIPDDIEVFKTDGEKLFYHFLATVAKPDDQYLYWYSPEVNDAEPDFVLYHPELGLIVFEVKDWQLSQIRGVDPRTFVVVMGNREKSCTNPHDQAKGYLHEIKERLEADGRLVSHEHWNEGKTKVPISCGVVFPNINAGEYRQSAVNHDGVIPADHIFFWDDLNHYSDLYEPTGRRFHETLTARFPPRFPCRLTPAELHHLRLLLYPQIRILTVDRGPTPELAAHDATVRLLDHNQEVIARKFDQGHRIVRGPSGSGKTLVLVHQAAFLRKYNPKVKKILFLCYNVTLVNYLRRLLALQGAPLGPDGVEVLSFYDLCGRLTGEPVAHENQDRDYYDLVMEDALSRPLADAGRFDAILVDEGQDFSDTMLRVVLSCLNPKTDILTIALDDGQDVYRPERSWSGLGIKARGRTRILDAVYRNTLEIADFARQFRGTAAPPKVESPQTRLFPDPRICRGPCPEILPAASLAEAVTKVADAIRDLLAAGLCPMAEIAVLYTRKQPVPGLPLSLPAMIAAALDQRGILSRWLSEDYRAKKSYDITADSITISTIHSVKGLDFACVFLMGLDALEPDGRWSATQIDSLAYVGITRARYRLIIPYVKKNALVDRLYVAEKSCHEAII